MKNRLFLYFILLIFSFSFPVCAQSVKQLEQERKETLKKMETTNKMLNEAKKSQQSSLNKLTILNNTIRERKTLIGTINKEIGELDNEARQLNRERQQLEDRLKVLKADYAKLIQESYINRNNLNKWMFVFSAESFDQSYRRLRYIQEYSTHRKEQAKQIAQVTQEIDERTKTLNENRLTKLSVLQQRESEASKLSKDQQSEKKMLNNLKKKEKNLRAELKKQEKKAAQLNKKIEEMIAEEIRKSEEKAKKNQKPGSTEKISPEMMLTKEEKLISGNFETNKGKLPWPVERGFISQKYGVQPHPVLKHVTTDNKGVNIQTPMGGEARSVFDGEVTQRFAIPGNNNAVIIKHGAYRTVYANLTEIYVKVGDKVKPKQKLGKIYTDDENENKTELIFQLWQDKTIMNPEPWIAK